MSDKWVILGKSNCVYCDKAKELLNSYGFTYSYFDLNETLTAFATANGFTTVPVIYRNGEYVGGYEVLKYDLYYERGNPPRD